MNIQCQVMLLKRFLLSFFIHSALDIVGCCGDDIRWFNNVYLSCHTIQLDWLFDGDNCFFFKVQIQFH